MIEETIIAYLNNKLSNGVEAYAEIPASTASTFVVVQKTGSGRSNYLDSSTFAFQSYADTRKNAALLNEEVKSIIDGSVELGKISKAALNSDYDFTDPNTKRYRYQAVYNITHY